jgi:hypothetical protein
VFIESGLEPLVLCDNPAFQFENEVKHDEVFIVVLRKFLLEANLYRHYKKKHPSLLDAHHFVGGRLTSLEHCRTLGTLRSADSAPADCLVATVSAAVFLSLH